MTSAASEHWQLVLFDFDGVLFDSCRTAITLVEDLRRRPEFAVLPSPGPDGHFGSLYRGELRHALLRFGLDAASSRQFFDAHASGMRTLAADLSLFPGVAPFFARIPARRYAIVTSSYSSVVLSAFAKEGVALDPARVVGHEVRKTKTEKILDLLTADGLRPEDAVYVGDMESDVLYCRSVPVRCIAASYGYHPSTVLIESAPLMLVDTPDELFTALAKGYTHEGVIAD